MLNDTPWWLEAGVASCEFCAVAYHEEIAVYCTECDRPVCPICAVEMRETRAVVCPACCSEAQP